MKRRLRIFITLFVIGCASIYSFFYWFESVAIRLEEEKRYDWAAANAIKHAYAAGELYLVLRMVYLSESAAENLVVHLGFLNEYAERAFKIRYPDATHEVMRDLYNNQIGIRVAHHHHTHTSPKPLLEKLMQAADNKLLLTDPDALKSQSPTGELRNTRAAIDWFKQQQSQIKETVGF